MEEEDEEDNGPEAYSKNQETRNKKQINSKVQVPIKNQTKGSKSKIDISGNGSENLLFTL